LSFKVFSIFLMSVLSAIPCWAIVVRVAFSIILFIDVINPGIDFIFTCIDINTLRDFSLSQFPGLGFRVKEVDFIFLLRLIIRIVGKVILEFIFYFPSAIPAISIVVRAPGIIILPIIINPSLSTFIIIRDVNILRRTFRGNLPISCCTI